VRRKGNGRLVVRANENKRKKIKISSISKIYMKQGNHYTLNLINKQGNPSSFRDDIEKVLSEFGAEVIVHWGNHYIYQFPGKGGVYVSYEKSQLLISNQNIFADGCLTTIV
jgi:hypothetical protein